MRLDETPFLPRLQRVVANRELDHLRFDSAAVDGDGYCVTGPDGPIRFQLRFRLWFERWFSRPISLQRR